jgi:hypothetical protein
MGRDRQDEPGDLQEFHALGELFGLVDERLALRCLFNQAVGNGLE